MIDQFITLSREITYYRRNSVEIRPEFMSASDEATHQVFSSSWTSFVLLLTHFSCLLVTILQILSFGAICGGRGMGVSYWGRRH